MGAEYIENWRGASEWLRPISNTRAGCAGASEWMAPAPAPRARVRTIHTAPRAMGAFYHGAMGTHPAPRPMGTNLF